MCLTSISLIKQCTDCGLDLEQDAFYLDKRYGKYSAACKKCLVERNKKCRQANQAQYNKNSRKRRSERKQRAVEYKGGKCMECGGMFHFSAFDFHHRDPQTKHKDPGLMMGSTDEVLFKELDKCDLLCANCHRIKHYHEGY